ncbi:hypothetical protein BT93_C1095 [Corymbia citriodora subsp. variegata]|nr:hypothetical protein BT93_C1095 [Corymbia citriodora subsp. variegata]
MAITNEVRFCFCKINPGLHGSMIARSGLTTVLSITHRHCHHSVICNMTDLATVVRMMSLNGSNANTQRRTLLARLLSSLSCTFKNYQDSTSTRFGIQATHKQFASSSAPNRRHTISCCCKTTALLDMPFQNIWRSRTHMSFLPFYIGM